MEIAFGAHPDDVYHVDEVGYLQLRPAPTRPSSRPARWATSSPAFAACATRAWATRSSTRTTARASCCPGYRDVQVDGVRRHLPDRLRPVRGPARRAREAGAQRRVSLHYEPESSTALGFGFRCGFLGLLHMEIVQERLEREFNLEPDHHGARRWSTTSTGPTATMLLLENPSKLPDPAEIDRIDEPYVKARIMAPAEYIGGIMKLGQERRGVYNGMHYIDTTRVEFDFEFPLGEIVLDFYDKLKSLSRGYASLDYEMAGTASRTS